MGSIFRDTQHLRRLDYGRYYSGLTIRIPKDGLDSMTRIGVQAAVGPRLRWDIQIHHHFGCQGQQARWDDAAEVKLTGERLPRTALCYILSLHIQRGLSSTTCSRCHLDRVSMQAGLRMKPSVRQEQGAL